MLRKMVVQNDKRFCAAGEGAGENDGKSYEKEKLPVFGKMFLFCGGKVPQKNFYGVICGEWEREKFILNVWYKFLTQGKTGKNMEKAAIFSGKKLWEK